MLRPVPRLAALLAVSLVLGLGLAAARPPASALAANFTLTLTASGPGNATGGGSFAPGAVATLHPIPNLGAIFVGWTIDGVFDGWADPREITMNADHTVVAYFAARPSFPDVLGSDPAYEAISQLAARGIIHGYQGGTFGPADPTLRAQMAALIARAIPSDTHSGPGIGPQTWALEDHSNPFTDQGVVDNALWRNVGTLNFYNVAHGYTDMPTCASAGVGIPCYLPTDQVTYVQVISFITRALVAKGYWQEATVDDPTLYPNIPAASGHRLDVLTYYQNTEPIPGTSPAVNWANWDQPATRAWFALALWQALDNIF